MAKKKEQKTFGKNIYIAITYKLKHKKSLVKMRV